MECKFCESLQRNKDIRMFMNNVRKQEGQEKIYEEYTVALVIRSFAKGKKATAGRVTEYRHMGIGYKLNYCPECGVNLRRNKNGTGRTEKNGR